MEQFAPRCAEDSVRIEGIFQMKPVIVAYGPERGNRAGHLWRLSVPVKGMCRGLKRAFTRLRAAIE
jgi:methyl coenzyme M reductase subunit D